MMKRSRLILCLWACWIPTISLAGEGDSAKPGSKDNELKLDFEAVEIGKLPADWTVAATNGKTSTAEWQVTEQDSRKALTLAKTTSSSSTYNLCVYGKFEAADVDLSLRFKALTGEVDQGGGPVWRYVDQDNYYICRANPLESNFRVYKVVAGARTQLASFDIELEAGKWYAIRIVAEGKKISCYLDGEKRLEAEDGALTAPGRIGLWTKADAATAFDSITIKKLDK